MKSRAELVQMIRGAEWAGRVWTDFESCPWCGALKGGLPRVERGGKVFEREEPLAHRPACPFPDAVAA